MKRASIVVAAFLCVLALSAAASRAEEGSWVKLGSRTVEYKTDHDTIDVGKSEGKFTAIRFKVEDGDLLMEKIKVTFGNGDTFEPTTKFEFKEGDRSHNIELPPKVAGRVIVKVDFIYRSERKHDKATVVLYGKEK